MDEPSTEWEFEVVRRVRDGEDEETALAGVIELFLKAGKPEALVHAIKLFLLKAGKPIPALTRRLIVAMFEEDPSKITNEPVQVRFNVKLRGRSHTGDEFWPLWYIRSGHKALTEDREPYRRFWETLADGLIAGIRKTSLKSRPQYQSRSRWNF